MVLSYLKIKIKEQDFKPDFLLQNCGQHDIKRTISTNKIQIPEQEYQQNLESIIKLLRKKQIRLIWITTTPVIDSIHNANQRSFHRYAANLQRYNKIAGGVRFKNKIPVIDLCSFTEDIGTDQFTDHVHYKEPVSALQAAYIAGYIQYSPQNYKTR